MIVLSGGTGTPKLIRGLRRLVPDEEITVIVNTAEDLMVSGNLVSPDMDTVLYLFAGMLDESKWWGVKDETYHTNTALGKLGHNEKMLIGDTDRATHIFRSELMRNGAALTEATAQLSAKLGVRARILPMCDEKVDTMITTPDGVMHFQDFWIGARGEPEVLDVGISGIETARATEAVLDALESEDNVIIGPSNPITSIGPILALKGMRKILAKKKVLAISPIIGNAPVSGPAGKLMKAAGFEVSSMGVARCYEDLIDVLVVDERDGADEGDFPVRTVKYDTMMTSVENSEALAGFLIGLFSNFG
ncbi:MAG: 2-phospho-L-lactate transferase [Candidatus Methanoperedens sp.]|jgi:LPPG:FO 2-phospho-L-lactate transferase|nr:2-phospho-L-lactate transferase [Candidatus Methanoperedens sp.]PKL53669.1 MAG: 2-phospho-L-lactate transferase [Candidatus Methanoperedenaceae archaeon HGW-Methanoperedenaceae-1]